MRKTFLVDYENTALRGLYGLSELSAGDKIVIFCSSEVIMKSLKDIFKIYNEKSIEIKTYLLNKRGNNALDFMIATYLGFEVCGDLEQEIYILSADKGYESAITLAKNLNKNVKIDFKECIYDCLHNTKQNVNAIVSSKEIAVSKEENVKIISPKKGKEIFMEKMKKENKIPKKYIEQIVALIYKHRNNKGEFERHTSRCLGEQNAKYTKVALEYYKEYKSHVNC